MRFAATGNLVKVSTVRRLVNGAREVWTKGLWGPRIGETVICKIDHDTADAALGDFEDDDQIFANYDSKTKRLIIGAGFLRV